MCKEIVMFSHEDDLAIPKEVSSYNIMLDAYRMYQDSLKAKDNLSKEEEAELMVLNLMINDAYMLRNGK